MEKRIITISREFGSGGRFIGGDHCSMENDRCMDHAVP